jgi:hypothetical protein
MKVYKNKLIPKHVRDLMRIATRLSKRKSRAITHKRFWKLAHRIMDIDDELYGLGWNWNEKRQDYEKIVISRGRYTHDC